MDGVRRHGLLEGGVLDWVFLHILQDSATFSIGGLRFFERKSLRLKTSRVEGPPAVFFGWALRVLKFGLTLYGF